MRITVAALVGALAMAGGPGMYGQAIPSRLVTDARKANEENRVTKERAVKAVKDYLKKTRDIPSEILDKANFESYELPAGFAEFKNRGILVTYAGGFIKGGRTAFTDPTSWSKWWVLRTGKGIEDLDVIVFSDRWASKLRPTTEELNIILSVLSAGSQNDDVGIRRKAALTAAIFCLGPDPIHWNLDFCESEERLAAFLAERIFATGNDSRLRTAELSVSEVLRSVSGEYYSATMTFTIIFKQDGSLAECDEKYSGPFFL
jgi:hypothetical protein